MPELRIDYNYQMVRVRVINILLERDPNIKIVGRASRFTNHAIVRFETEGDRLAYVLRYGETITIDEYAESDVTG